MDGALKSAFHSGKGVQQLGTAYDAVQHLAVKLSKGEKGTRSYDPQNNTTCSTFTMEEFKEMCDHLVDNISNQNIQQSNFKWAVETL